MDDQFLEGLVGAVKSGHEAALAEGYVQPPALFCLTDGRLAAHVTLRPVRVGQDALTAIAEMSALAVAAEATEVAAVWETQDIAAACDLVALCADTALNVVVASSGRHVVHRFPYRERMLPGRTGDGAFRIAPQWLPPCPPEPGGELEPGIAGLLAFCWDPAGLSGRNLLEQTMRWLGAQGYRASLFAQDASGGAPAT